MPIIKATLADIQWGGATKRLNLYNYGVLSNLYIYFKIKNGNSDFYEQYFEAGLLNKEIHQIAQEGARNHGLLNISVVDFFNILIALPPLKEQEKIADILSTWDMAISNLDELIIQKQKLKTALMQNLLSAKIRFKEFTAPWQEVKLGDILDYEQPTKYIVNNVAYVNDMYKIPVLTAGKSFILGYTDETNGIYDKLPVILFDDFTTDTKFVNFKFKVKSSAIKLLKPKDKTATILKIIYETMELIKFSTEDHKRYWISEYQYLQIPLPPLKEQQKIAEVLSACDDEINLLKDKLSNLKLQKQGLMQNLLTGKVRVRV
ncbi:restriction endonuclease subunit S [Campylobacter fetus]|uniref:restriction endonuclease subunit S n=1 Tax=Campylobacter fetus TaxID=196 RepID=UPI00168CBAD4|nr:restriction endonuclease subunit S [Campylobacter fetus]MBD3864961.1 restriction endonuclease subunit S [Campylobacter fetus]